MVNQCPKCDPEPTDPCACLIWFFTLILFFIALAEIPGLLQMNQTTGDN